MTVRIVPLRSADASEARVEGTVADRISMVRELSRLSWALTRRVVPEYARSAMPVTITTLRARGGD